MCEISGQGFKSFRYILVGVVVLVLVLLVTGVKQSQLLDSSLGLGLEFDKIIGVTAIQSRDWDPCRQNVFLFAGLSSQL